MPNVMNYGNFPLIFEVNQGQTDSQVEFLVRGKGYTMFLTPTESVLVLRQPEVKEQALDRLFNPDMMPTSAKEVKTSAVRMSIVGANPNPQVEGLEELPGKVNYFIGNDPDKWRTDIPSYAKVKYREIYPGIDIVYYGNQGQLEYDLVVAPGADPNSICLEIQGAETINVNSEGNLLLNIANGQIRLQKPQLYQELNNTRKEIFGAFVLKDNHQIGFAVGTYDAAKPLIIDPVLIYSTFLGGSSRDGGRGIAVDSAGNAYVTGYTESINFPPQGPIHTDLAGGEDAFVTKINTAGNALVYSTYLGGSSDDVGTGIAVDSACNAYVTGFTGSSDFPTQNPIQSWAGGEDAFVSKINAAGNALVYSTYLGGSSDDVANGVVVDSSGNAYVTGVTGSSNFPTQNPIQSWAGDYDAFVTKINAAGNVLVYSTYLGGSDNDAGHGIAVDTAGNAYVTGSTRSNNFPTQNPIQSWTFTRDAFVTKINAAGTTLLYSTYLGGSGSDVGTGIAVDLSGNAYVTGLTQAKNFPTQNPIQANLANVVNPSVNFNNQDVFVTKINAAGNALVYSTYLGGLSMEESGFAIAVDSSGNAYVTGVTGSDDFPIKNPIEEAANLPGINGVFVTKINATGNLVFSNYLGGSFVEMGRGIAVDSYGNAYVTGETISGNFPDKNPIQSWAGSFDAFVTKLTTTPQGDIQFLIEEVEGLVASGVINSGQGNALITHLRNANWQLNCGNCDVAIAQLQAFINQVDVFFIAGIIPQFIGIILVITAINTINLINSIRSDLNCKEDVVPPLPCGPRPVRGLIFAKHLL